MHRLQLLDDIVPSYIYEGEGQNRLFLILEAYTPLSKYSTPSKYHAYHIPLNIYHYDNTITQ